MSVKKPSDFKGSVRTRRSDKYHVDMTAPLIFCTVEAIIILAVCLAFDHLFAYEDSRFFSNASMIFLSFYLLSAGMICLIYAIKAWRTKRARAAADSFSTDIQGVFKDLIDLPYAIIDREGKVKVMNGALQDVLGYKSAVSGVHLSEFCSIGINVLASRSKNRDVYQKDAILDLPEQSPAKYFRHE